MGEYEGLLFDPCIPAHWEGYTIEKTFRGKQISIQVKNPDRVQKGVKALWLNGVKLDGQIIKYTELAEENNVEVLMG